KGDVRPVRGQIGGVDGAPTRGQIVADRRWKSGLSRDVVVSGGDVVENTLRLRRRAGVAVRGVLAGGQRIKNEIRLAQAGVCFLCDEREDGCERRSGGGSAPDQLSVGELSGGVGGANPV